VLDNQLISERTGRLSGAGVVRRIWLLIAAALLAAVLVGSASRSITAGAAKEGGDRQVSGAGKTIIEGGTGAPSYIPVTTVLAFHANGQGGDFECLALAPMAASGAPESGQF
jgi:hypothetical protein